MNLTESTAAKASLKWVGSDSFKTPWLKYNPTINVANVAELNMSVVGWDIVVREIRSIRPDELMSEVVFQFASRRAPHNLLQIGLEFELYEGPENCVWKGIVNDIWQTPRDPNYWCSEM